MKRTEGSVLFALRPYSIRRRRKAQPRW